MAGLVTLFGGGGFVGRYAAQALLRRGVRVRIAGRDPRRAFFLKPQGELGQTQFVAADITRPETLGRAVAGSDAVVNLVGVLSGAFDAVHVDGAANVAHAAARAGASALVHLSAIGADPAAVSRYARSKGAGEAAVLAAFPRATVLRPSVVFGPEDDFLNRFARLIQILPAVPVIAGGTRFQPVFAGDVGQAIARAALEPGTAVGATLALGGPEIVSMTELNRLIATMIGRTPRLLELPDAAAALIARLPGGPLTTDQFTMLRHDNVVGDQVDGLAALGIGATAIETVAPGWLVKFRRLGRFGAERRTI